MHCHGLHTVRIPGCPESLHLPCFFLNTPPPPQQQWTLQMVVPGYTLLCTMLGEGKIGLPAGGGGGVRGSPPKEGGGVWQWGSCDRTLGKVPITSNRGC